MIGESTTQTGEQYADFPFGDSRRSWTFAGCGCLAHLVFGRIRKPQSCAKRRAQDRLLAVEASLVDKHYSTEISGRSPCPSPSAQ